MPMRFKLAFILILFSFVLESNAQTPGGGFLRYQSVARNSAGFIIASQPLSVKIGIYSSTILYWEETQAVVTDQNGLFVINVGSGATTGAGALSSFSLINWAASLYSIRISSDYTGGSTYELMGQSDLMSVPYSFNSIKTNRIENLYLNDLADVNTTANSIGYLLKWDGVEWKPLKDNDSDTVNFAYNSFSSLYSDTASYSYVSGGWADTVIFSNESSSSIFSNNSTNSVNSESSVYSDTADYSLNTNLFNWTKIGNSLMSSTKFIGTTDSSDLVFRTSNIEKMRWMANARLGIGTSSPSASVSIVNTSGLLAVGTFGSGALIDSTSATKFVWNPNKSSLRFGQITTNAWGDSQIGSYSIAGGYNCIAGGLESFAMGINSQAMSENFVVIGNNCYGIIPPGDPNGGGASIAIGDSIIILGTRSIGMGHAIVIGYGGGCGFGYRNKCQNGSSTSVWGANNNANDSYDIVMGSNASNNLKKGCFVFGDATSDVQVLNTQDQQFMARASGGVVFYSDAALTTGVQLFSGSGSWSMLSDKNKKENFEIVDGESFLNKISTMKIESWSYKSQGRKIKHVGPLAQDFYTMFNFGESDSLISVVDINGVTLSGIKALIVRTNKLFDTMNEINNVEIKTAALKMEYDDMEERLKKLENSITK